MRHVSGVRASWIIGGMAVLIASRLAAAAVFPIYDDAFITFRYARNVAAGLGLVYEAGEYVLGVTTPLFAFLLAGVAAVGIPLELFVRPFNLGVECLMVLLLARTLAGGRWAGASVLLPLVAAASPSMARVTIGGMEANLFALSAVLAIKWYHDGRVVIAVLLATVSYFLRPEALSLVAVLLIGELVRGRWARAVALGGMSAAVLAPPLALIYRVYGHVLPQSMLAKAELGSTLLQVGQAFLWPDPGTALISVLALFGWGLAVREGGVPQLLAVWVAVYVGAYALARPMIWSWYSYPLFMGNTVFATIAIATLAASVWRARVDLRVVATAIGLVAIAGWAGILGTRYPDAVVHRVYQPLAAWCREHARPGDVMLAGDIGALGYYCHTRILDTAGLVSPEMLAYATETEAAARYAPLYLFLNADQRSLGRLRASPVGAAYEPVARFSKSGQTSLEPDLAGLPYVWTQDYILFRRRGPARAAIP